jgi:hypothetical protein
MFFVVMTTGEHPVTRVTLATQLGPGIELLALGPLSGSVFLAAQDDSHEECSRK